VSTIRELRAALLARRVSPVELVRAALARIEREDPVLRAWVHVDAKAALAAAEAADVARGPLAGIPFGVKDVIDVRGMPTRHGIRAEHARPAVADAWCVAAVRAAGAIPIGKVATTPFAFRDPPAPTRNPWDHARTPGGSSAGSAACVGARHVPFSFGTQTGGSTLRPAAYCGAAAMITTLGKVPTLGMQPLAPTLDRVGLFCRTAEDLTTLLGVYDPAVLRAPTPKQVRIGFARGFQDSVVDAPVAKVIDQVLNKFPVEEIALPALVVEGAVHWEDIMCFELTRLVRPSLGEEIGSKILAASLQRGAAIGYAAYAEKLTYRERAQAEFDKLFSSCDVIAHAAAGSPPDRSTTGHTQLPLSWPPTALGLPAISLPVGLTPERLPVGLQLVGRHGEDAQLLAAARFVEQAVPFSADPLRL
jgi:Asp-tRNA(Asn)/Glu-tRNA(Gln) amidotransferase A subunit family amidase